MERKTLDEDAETSAACGFIDDDEIEEGDRSDDDHQVERVCAICDNGGDLLCCEGECMRSFHATEEDNCESLGFAKAQVEAKSNFYCKNCQYRRHQCFACGKLGSSDKNSAAAEVFRCVSGECGRFYHPYCVSKLLHRDSEAESEVLKEKIANGASFTCPFHKCCVCNQGETEEDDELRFAMCRRCPKSYHKKCLPREISFEDLEEDDIIQRAWEDLMPKKRILIYCLEHEIDYDIGTPVRNHIRFPAQASELLSRREIAPVSKNASRRTSVRPALGRDKLSSATRPDSLNEQRVRDISWNPLNRTSSKIKSTPDESKTFHTVKSVANETSNILPLNAESKKRILALMKDASSKITLEKINEKHKPPTTHACSSKNVIDKTITLGKVEGSVEALRAALRKLEEGSSMEDAKAVCGPGLLSQMMKWKNKLKIYLAPILHGMRYTSYGRHFTKSDKLKKIVDMLYWYAQDGDMIIDFGCGANEFSCLMKKKLDEVGKKCSYKNYDIIYPKNDFNFEQRNWLTVHPNELPPGSQLIMGLNPPFGVNANLANQFINKALQFKPKLIILIVPPETERLDEKDPPYDLVFEDNDLLAGKSFYLPGSVDVNDKQMEQWNRIPPPLYFWSRQDWTANHKAIAQQQGHLHRGREVSHMVGSHNQMHNTDFALGDNELNGGTSMLFDGHCIQTEEPEQLQEKAAGVTELHEEELPCANRRSEGCKNRENGNQKKSRGGKGKRRREASEISPEDKQKRKRYLLCQSHPALTPLDKGVMNESYQHLDGGFSGPHQFGEGYSGAGEDDMARKYGTNYEDPRSRNSQEQFSGYPRESMDNNGYRSHIDDSSGQRSSYMVSPDPRSSPYGSVADSSYNRMCSSTSTSTMQRHAPRLDETNPTRMNNLGSELPSLNRNSSCDRPAPRNVYRGDSLGFAPGPYHPYSQNNSAGWLNE